MDLQKKKPIRINKIRASARGEDCTVESPWCEVIPENENVVLAHYNEPGHGKMGGKDDDTSAVYACNMCHDWLDGRFTPPRNEYPWANKEFFWFRAMRRTWRRLIEKGVLK